MELIHMLDQFNDLSIPSNHLFVILPLMGKCTVRTVLESLFVVPEIAAAFPAQSIKRAVAEQAVKRIGICTLMTWEIFA